MDYTKKIMYQSNSWYNDGTAQSPGERYVRGNCFLAAEPAV